MSFGWADFPCIEDRDASFTLSSSYKATKHVPITSLFTPPTSKRNPDLAETSDSEDDGESITSEDSAVTVSLADLEAALAARRTRRRDVSFGDVEIRSYDVVLGDHPWSAAFPLSLDWSVQSTRTVTVDAYEQTRPPAFCFHTPRRLSKEQRRNRLIDTTDMEPSEVDALEEARQRHVEAITVPENGFGELLRVGSVLDLRKIRY